MGESEKERQMKQVLDDVFQIRKVLIDIYDKLFAISDNVKKLWELNDRLYGKTEETTDEEAPGQTNPT
jgi:hypothetical protein